MAELVHEIWEEVDEGMVLHTCCLAGPLGDGCRRNLDPRARLLTAFVAGSHFEAMTLYNRLLGREPSTSREAWDFRPYPDAWMDLQQTAPREGTDPDRM